MFKNGFQLGGHMSKKHPGSSELYDHRKSIKEANSEEKKRNKYFEDVRKLHDKQYKVWKMANGSNSVMESS